MPPVQPTEPQPGTAPRRPQRRTAATFSEAALAAPPNRASRFLTRQPSPLNLIGKLEGWGNWPGHARGRSFDQGVCRHRRAASELLKKPPDGMTFELSLEKEDN